MPLGVWLKLGGWESGLYLHSPGGNDYQAPEMKVARSQIALWGELVSPSWVLTSKSVSVTVADHGAHLAAVVLHTGDGDVQISVPYPSGATTAAGYHGASVGRYANRIANAAFVLDGVEYQLDANEGRNQLHGGTHGFSSHRWIGDAETVGTTGRVELRHTSPAGDQGFPGGLLASSCFELTDRSLTIVYRAEVDASTPVNMTNHTYWNLAGGGSLQGHQLQIAAASYIAVDDENIPLRLNPMTIRDTRFDCTTARDLQGLVDEGGLDHSFELDPTVDIHATLSHANGRKIDVSTNQVGLQVYTGQHLAPDARGVALETQCHPDTPNRPDLGDCTVREDAGYEASTTFRFDW